MLSIHKIASLRDIIFKYIVPAFFLTVLVSLIYILFLMPINISYEGYYKKISADSFQVAVKNTQLKKLLRQDQTNLSLQIDQQLFKIDPATLFKNDDKTTSATVIFPGYQQAFSSFPILKGPVTLTVRASLWKMITR